MTGGTLRAGIYSIPAGVAFVDALARGLMDEAAGDPLALSRMVVLLPTRRACRSLRDAFLRLGEGRPMLLPRLMPLGELDEEELLFAEEPAGAEVLDLPPAVPPLRRQLMLTRLVQAMGPARGGRAPSVDQAARLAAELARLLDQVQTEQLDFARLKDLVPEEYAEHWQTTLRFLEIVTEAWPRVLAEEGWVDPAERRNALLRAQAQAWRQHAPSHPVIVAGSTGSVPATAALIEVVAGLPRGMVVLPGLDSDMDPESWEALEPQHPQFGLKRLLDRLRRRPAEVRPWPVGAPNRPRARLIAEAMRPSATTDAWRHLDLPDAEAALEGLSLIEAPGPREEAGAIAVLLREALEAEGRTVALVTPDRALARRVAAEMRRWGVEVDDSGGRPLALTPPGVFLRLSAGMLAEDCAPHPLLAALKHPLAAGGVAAPEFRRRVRRLEREVLRGPRPEPGFAGLRRALGGDDPLARWVAGLEEDASELADLMARPVAPLADLLRAHVAFAEALAADDRQPGAERLWRGEDGEAAARFVADLLEAAAVLPEVPGRDYPALLETLMAGQVVRPRWGGHPRLHIWGPLEARLQRADRIILGGLNEGSWPPEPDADPWMSRPMRQDFGLPSPERRIGLAAHDFAQAACAPEVVLSRAVKAEGSPTVPSRWLLRLDAVLQAAGLSKDRLRAPWLDWFAGLDRPDAIRPHGPPAPRPPVAARPRQLSATRIEAWMRDPYAIYAQYVLRLRALDPIDADPGAADYGTIVHKALETFFRAHPRRLPPDARERLLACGREAFRDVLDRPGVWAFWWPRFERIAEWVAGHEAEAGADVAERFCEVRGELEFDAPGGPFRLTATADRIDLLADGTLGVIDYKTGAPPSAKEVKAGFAPQLPLEAAIARAGGFRDIPAKPVARLRYWRLSGGDPAGKETSAGEDAEALAAEALANLKGLVAVFDRAETAYEARPRPDKAPRFSDYEHLARVKEWATGTEEGE